MLGKAGLVEILIEKLKNFPPPTSIDPCLQVDCKLSLLESRTQKQDCDLDAIDSATCALANVLSLHTPNTIRLLAVGGLEVIFKIFHSHSYFLVDLLDFDKEIRIRGNAANVLTNVLAAMREEGCLQNGHFGKRLRDNETNKQLQSLAPALISLCAASLQSARRAAALLLGNLALESELRVALGEGGAIEALWSAYVQASDKDQCNITLWALSNLVWSSRANQERCGPFLESAVSAAYKSAHTFRQPQKWTKSAVKHNNIVLERAWTLCLVANALYFNEPNRARLICSCDSIEKLVVLAGPYEPPIVREPALRCLISITSTYRGVRRVVLSDYNSGACKTFVRAISENAYGAEGVRLQQLGAAALANICTSTDARKAV